MNKRTALAVALGSGYLLGRTKKLRLALMVGGAIATGKASSASAGLLKRGAEKLAQNTNLDGLSPAVGEISDAFTGKLAEAAKAAALAVVTSKANALADVIGDRADALRSGGATTQGSGDRDAADRLDQDGEDGREQDIDDRRAGQTRSTQTRGSRSAVDGRHDGHAKRPAKRPDGQGRPDQGQSRGNGRHHSPARDDHRARNHAER